MPTPRVQAAAEGMPSFPGYEAAFHRLANPIGRLCELAKVQEALLSLACDGKDVTTLGGDVKDAVSFLASEIRTEAGELDQLWLDFHNAAPDEEPAKPASRTVRVPLKSDVR